jgi:hypothetical protein
LKNWWSTGTVLNPDTIESENPDPGRQKFKKEIIKEFYVLKPWMFLLEG